MAGIIVGPILVGVGLFVMVLPLLIFGFGGGGDAALYGPGSSFSRFFDACWYSGIGMAAGAVGVMIAGVVGYVATGRIERNAVAANR